MPGQSELTSVFKFIRRSVGSGVLQSSWEIRYYVTVTVVPIIP